MTLIAPPLTREPVCPPRISTPVELSTSVIEIEPLLVRVLLLSTVTATGAVTVTDPVMVTSSG